MRTAPQRERSDTPDPCRGFIGHGKDADGTTPIPAEGSPASDPTRPIPVEGSSATARMRTAPQRERAQGFARHHSESAPTRPIPVEGSSASSRIFARHHSESAPTRPIPVEGSSASSRMRTAPQRERADTPDPCREFIGPRQDGHGTTARALRHARSL